MVSNYFKIALRNIQRHRGYAFINIAGLAAGLTVCFLILFWVMDELSFDRFHTNAKSIHRVYCDVQAGSRMTLAMTMPPLKAAVLEIPEVQHVTRIGYPGRNQIAIGDETMQEDLVGFADKDIFNVFSFHLLRGDPETALEAPYTTLLSRTTAEKYFGEDDPIGSTMKIGGDTEYTITGIFEDTPVNSHMRFNIMRSYETLYAEQPEAMAYWMHIQFYTYIRLIDNADPKDVEAKFPAIVETHVGDLLQGFGGSLALFLQPLTRIHLHSNLLGEISPGGNMTYIALFIGIALFVLVIASMNFINLATARSAGRAKEVGLRKTLGAHRKSLIGQFLGESIILSFLSLILAVMLTSLLFPWFESLIGRTLSIEVLNDIRIIGACLGMTLFTGLAAGAYPAFLLSSFHPTRALKNAIVQVTSKSYIRRVLVVFQFSISILLIIGTMTIYRQIHFMKNKHLGLDKEHVVVLSNVSDLVSQRSLSMVREEFLRIPGVTNVAGSFLMPSRSIGKGIYTPEGFTEDQPQTTNRMGMDAHVIPTLRMELTAGRNFSEDLTTDSETMIINETAARRFGWTDPIGKTISMRTPDGRNLVRRVIGVVKDFHHLSLHEVIEPLVISYTTENITHLSIRMVPGDIAQSMEMIEARWGEIAPVTPFEFFFLDDSYDSLYRTEERVGQISLVFCGLTILIGCLGLFGLAAYTAERRTKEIGIRKVLGASTSGMIHMVSKEFILLVCFANLTAWPLAYFGMPRWLQNFAYRTNLPWTLFLGASLLAVIVALITVSYQAANAARTNPADALRYE